MQKQQKKTTDNNNYKTKINKIWLVAPQRATVDVTLMHFMGTQCSAPPPDPNKTKTQVTTETTY